MCSRLDIDGETLSRQVKDRLGVDFHPDTNRDLHITDPTAALVGEGTLVQVTARWGLLVPWMKGPLHNAKFETVTTKQTFAKHFAFHRCIVPITGWYEWQPGLSGKVRFWLGSRGGDPLYMAGIWYPGDDPRLVTLTCPAPRELARLNHRFPVFIPPDQVRAWLASDPVTAQRHMTTLKHPFYEFCPVK